ncbi:MAG: pentapeptide repeat-containing protein, partial [Boseongicola sp. SB0670_bin_30]|nr:pentapeptide repeat-containing protein [Boseongicola sp. SB0670_bin_30]
SLDDVDLGGAKLWLSDLSGVDLSGARNLTQSQLDASCIDPRATVRLPAGGDLTTVEAERHFETCRALKADPFKRHALFELLFKLSADASGDRLGFLEERHWGSHKTVEMWLSFQVPAVSDLVNQSVPPTLTRNVGMLGDYLFRKKADAQAAGMPSGGDIGQPVVLSSFTDDEIEVLRSKLCQDPPWAISCLCRKVDEAESRQPGSGESGLCRPGHLPP